MSRFSHGLTLLLFQMPFTLCLFMLKLIFSFSVGCRPSPRDWSNLCSKRNHICKKYMFLGLGPSTWYWSPNSLDVNPLLGIRLIFSKRNYICKKFMFLDRGPLHHNGRQILGCRPSPWDWSNLFQKEIIFAKSICFWIEALYMVMVTESFGCRPFPWDWFNLFQK